MSIIVARWWTFQDPLPVARQQLRVLRQEADSTDGELSVLFFDGRRHGRETGKGDADLTHALPRRYCQADVRPRACRTGGGDTGRRTIPKYAVTISVSPTSPLWAPVTKGGSANYRDHAARLTYRSFEGYARHHRVRQMPHLVEGYCVRKGKATAADVARVAETLADVLRERRGRGAAAGGVDFVPGFKQMGSLDLLSLLSATPQAWPRLRERFDEMHKIMFGPLAMFASLPAADTRATFETVRRVLTPAGEQAVAVARTRTGLRKFKRRPESLMV
jgi:hypothetical protein